VVVGLVAATSGGTNEVVGVVALNVVGGSTTAGRGASVFLVLEVLTSHCHVWSRRDATR